MRRTVKDSFLKVRALRARELRDVVASLNSLARFLFYICTFDCWAFFKYNYCRNLKEVILWVSLLKNFITATLIRRLVAQSGSKTNGSIDA